MEDIRYAYEEIDYGKDGEWFSVKISLPSGFKEIRQTKAIDEQALIGNMGGYIGLFLGQYGRIIWYISLCCIFFYYSTIISVFDWLFSNNRVRYYSAAGVIAFFLWIHEKTAYAMEGP